MEKLNQAVTVKFCENGIADLHALSSARGMEVCEYIRNLVREDKKKAKAQFDALKPIFLHDDLFDKENEV